MKNIMIQVCAKRGGSPWGLKGLPMFTKPVMIIGIDAQHNIGRNKESVLGFSATMDRYCSKYFSDTVVKPKEEVKGSPIDVVFELETLF